MKVVCQREDLLRGLQIVQRSVGARAGIPALSGVLLDVTADELVLQTTDLEITTRVTVPITGAPGQALLPARYLSDIVRTLPGAEVELFGEDGVVRIEGASAHYSLRSLPAEDFPRTQSSPGTRTFTLDGSVLAKAVAQVASAASRDETRPVLTGVLFESDGVELRLVATDSYRLGLRRLQLPEADAIKLIVPARAISEVARIAAGKQVQVSIGGPQISFETGDVFVQSRLIEGEFPAYKQLVPENLPYAVVVDKARFIEELRGVAVLAQDATPVFLEIEAAQIRFTCQAQGVGEGARAVDCTYDGEPMRVAFNPQYLEHGVDAVEGDQVKIEVSEAQRPVLIRGIDSSEFAYLLMPIRVG